MNWYSILNILMILLAIWVLLYQYRRTGVAATPMNLFIIRSILILFVTYPFLQYGLETIGWSEWTNILRASDQALLICSTGTAVFLASAILLPPLLIAAAVREEKSETRRRIQRTETSEVYAACILMMFGIALIWLTFAQTGTIPFLAERPSVARTFSDVYETYASVRPLYQLGNTVCGLAVGFVTAWCLLRRRVLRIPLPVLAALALALITLFLTANRGWVLNPLLQGVMVYFAIRWRQTTVVKILALGVLVVVLALGLQIVRRGSLTMTALKGIPTEFVAGNTFSDFRDFSWLLAEFDRKGYDFYYGKTIVAGYLGFIPSSISPFRQEYAWGRVSTDITGLDPEAMFGLRPGPFGEWYFNFGWPGVLFQALLLGVLAGFIDTLFLRQVKRIEAEDSLPRVYPVFVLWTVFSIVCGPLRLSSSGPGMIPQIAGLVTIAILASVLRGATVGNRSLETAVLAPRGGAEGTIP